MFKMPVEEEEVRILSFSKEWEKLNHNYFTTFRFKRRDKNWQIGEMVQIFYKSRSPKRKFLFLAKIVARDTISIKDISKEIAIQDGFKNKEEWLKWMRKTYRDRIDGKKMNRLRLWRLRKQ